MVGSTVPTKVSPLRTSERDLLKIRVFAGVIKDLKRRPCWVTQVGPKPYDKYPCER